MTSATVTRAGLLTTVQDLGRAGHRASGVSLGGALDSHAMRVANLLVGNDENAAGLEITLGNFRLRFNDHGVIAWCGGSSNVLVSGEQLAAGRRCMVAAGNEIIFAQPELGCRAWLAISGGIDVPLVLGSRSTDLRAGFGGFNGRALKEGDVLQFGLSATNADPHEASVASWGAPAEWASTASQMPLLRIVRGENMPLFTSAAQAALLSDAFTVTPEADRMGVRLRGATLARTEKADLLSEAVTPGTIQVPPNGEPIILLGDCQTIGGYPKIAHVITVDMPVAAQLRAGDRVRFDEVSLADAHRLLMHREDDLRRFRIGVSLRR
jgi:antagonist of KipI